MWQQRWCCRNRGMGCEPLALPFGPGPKEVTKVETLDCSVGSSWTEAQRRICCKDHGVGCLEAPMAPVAPVAPVAHVVTRVEEVPASHVFSAAAYHCHAGHRAAWEADACQEVRTSGPTARGISAARCTRSGATFTAEPWHLRCVLSSNWARISGVGVKSRLLKGISLPSLGQLRL